MNLNKFYSACWVIYITFLSLTYISQSPLLASDTTICLQRTEKSIVFISDTQSPIWIESLFLKERANLRVRSLLFEEIQRHMPGAVFHLGDQVAFGFCNNSWHEIDEFVKTTTQNNVPFYPALGNHELMLFSGRGMDRFMDRYPAFEKTGYLIRIDSLAIIMLNSNFDHLSEAEIQKQSEWLTKTTEQLDADSSVKMIIMACHHSPFTNSTIVDPDEQVRWRFVPVYINSQKARLFLSGHAHAFEHFRVGGKDFLVIGGGGGLQQPLLTGDAVRWEDNFEEKGEIRRFHYISLEMGRTPEVLLIMADSSYTKLETRAYLKFPDVGR
ncbi:MAG: metallophosphoesterase [Calditrichales bacterium]|nr:MAG: metallophosphoesterase [Calditrichales bacterium]